MLDAMECKEISRSAISLSCCQTLETSCEMEEDRSRFSCESSIDAACHMCTDSTYCGCFTIVSSPELVDNMSALWYVGRPEREADHCDQAKSSQHASDNDDHYHSLVRRTCGGLQRLTALVRANTAHALIIRCQRAVLEVLSRLTACWLARFTRGSRYIQPLPCTADLQVNHEVNLR